MRRRGLIQVEDYKNNPDHIVIFIHGLGGSKKSWVEKDKKGFIDAIFQNVDINTQFSASIFEYKSTFLDRIKKVRKVLSLVSFGRFSYSQNQSIEQTARILYSEVKSRLANVEISFVCHSLGGLVAKAFLVLFEDNPIPNLSINTYITIATPHQGASLAKAGILLSENPQIKQLIPENKFLSWLEEKWTASSLESKLNTKYIVATDDQVIGPEYKCYPKDVLVDEVDYFPFDHFNIIRGTQSNDSHIKLISNILLNHKSEDNSPEEFVNKNIILKSPPSHLDMSEATPISEYYQFKQQLTVNLDNTKQVRVLISSVYEQLKKFENETDVFISFSRDLIREEICFFCDHVGDNFVDVYILNKEKVIKSYVVHVIVEDKFKYCIN